jgi:16S rRNA C967 or C1407 C5-methylase (RsmB/RsmF family)
MTKKHTSEINDRFVEYFRENFFQDTPEELERFLASLTKPLAKTIRVNTNRISVDDFKLRAEKQGWILTPTNNPTVFRIDRTNIKMPLGHTLEHLLGYFYIQELSASMSVHYLTIPHPPSSVLTLSTSPLTPLLEREGNKKEENDEY